MTKIMIKRNFQKELKKINSNISINPSKIKCSNINRPNNNKLNNGINNFKGHSIIL